MKVYLEMLKNPVFTIKDVLTVCENPGTAKNHVLKLVANGYAIRIRKNLYTCISPETGMPIANKFQIASAITDTSFVSHHTAMEYYGVADQVYYDVYVSSSTKFSEFEYNGYIFKCIITKSLSNIDIPDMSSGIRITNIERSIIDSIKDLDKISGIEEVVSNIELLPLVDEKKLLSCLAEYNNFFLYQKTGFILENFQAKFHLSDSFFTKCKIGMGKSKRYLTKDMKCTLWNSQWKLMVPEKLFEMKNG